MATGALDGFLRGDGDGFGPKTTGVVELVGRASMVTLVTGMIAGVELVAGATTTSGELDTGVTTTSSRISGRGSVTGVTATTVCSC